MVWVLIEENQHGYVIQAVFHSKEALWVRMNKLEKMMPDLVLAVDLEDEQMTWLRTEKKIKYVAYHQEIE